jgi:alanine racemase
MSRVTIQDVAKAARVSATTVSFAFNQPDQLSEATRTRVLSTARRLGYAPHPSARSLSTKRHGSIGLLTPQPLEVVFANPFVSELLQGIGAVCAQHDMTLLLVPPLNGSLESAVGRAPVDGVISLGLNAGDPALETLARFGLPSILIDAEAPSGVATVNVDDFGGAALAAQHVLELGHRRIAVIGLGRTSPQRAQLGIGARRLAGYRGAIHAAGVPAPRVDPGGVTFAAGTRAFRNLWRVPRKPTAVLAMSDMAALGLMAAARDAGVRIPQDLSVVGFDDLPMAAWALPGLTTVRQPIVEKGRQAARLLIDTLAGKPVHSPKPLRTELIVRGSTGRQT